MKRLSQGMKSERNMEITSLGGKTKLHHNLDDLLDEAREHSNDGVIEIIVTEYESDKDAGVSMRKGKRLEIDLNNSADINDFIERTRPLSDIQSHSFILHEMCKLSIDEVAERLDVSPMKVQTSLQWAYGKIF